MSFGSEAPQVIVTAELRGSELHHGGREAGVSNREGAGENMLNAFWVFLREGEQSVITALVRAQIYKILLPARRWQCLNALT